jgi:hypothetical protein
LYQQVDSENEKQLLLKCNFYYLTACLFKVNWWKANTQHVFLKSADKDAVEKRLFVLQQQGYVTASFDDNFAENLPA